MRKKWIWGVALIVSVAGIFGYNMYRLNKSMPVDLVEVNKGTVAEKIYANGKLESMAVAQQIVRASGIVKELPVEENAIVKKGQLLLVLESEDIRQQLQMEQNNLKMIEAELSQRKKQDFEQIKSDVLAGKSVNQEDIDYSSYELRMANEKLVIDSLKEKLSHIQLFADQDGIITALNVKKGQEVQQGFAAMEITDVKSLQVRANLNELDANKAKLKMKAIISGDAFLNIYQGTVSYLAPVAVPTEPGSKDPAVELLVTVDQPSNELRPGYNATLEIALEQVPQWVVPLSAVQNDGDKTFVYKVDEGKTARVEVETGNEDEEKVEVLQGLKGDEQVIKVVPEDMDEGQKVKVQ